MQESQLKQQADFLSKKQRQQLKCFQEKLLEKNDQINLLSRKNPKRQIEKLLKEAEDSARVLKKFFQKKNQKVLDIGSGNGFPGLFFAIAFPQSQFYLCERIRKKAESLKWIGFQCQLSNIEVLCQSAENLKADYDLLLSQASMSPNKIKNLLKPFLQKETKAFLWVSERQIPFFQSSFVTERLPLSDPTKTILKLKQGSKNFLC